MTKKCRNCKFLLVNLKHVVHFGEFDGYQRITPEYSCYLSHHPAMPTCDFTQYKNAYGEYCEGYEQGEPLVKKTGDIAVHTDEHYISWEHDQ